MLKSLLSGAGLLVAAFALTATPAAAQTDKKTKTEVQATTPPGQTVVVKTTDDKTTVKPKAVKPQKTGTSKTDKKLAELNENEHEGKSKDRKDDSKTPNPQEMKKK